MIEGVSEQILARALMTPAEWHAGLEALRRTAGPDGVFCYTFFKGVAVRLRVPGGHGSPSGGRRTGSKA